MSDLAPERPSPKGARMILYVGPDQLIPLSGVFGTIFGLVLIFWGKVLQGLRKVGAIFQSLTSAEKTRS
jgi:hypothetical protein